MKKRSVTIANRHNTSITLEPEFMDELKNIAKKQNKTIVLPEAGYSKRIVLAGIECAKEGIAQIIFLVKDESELKDYDIKDIKNIKVINILKSDFREMLADALYLKRKDKGLTKEASLELMNDEIYFGTMMVELSLADGLVCGAEVSTSKTFKPALQIIKGKTKETKISSFFVMVRQTENGEEKYVLADCGMNINPTAEELACIAKDTARSAKDIAFIDEPKVAMLCYSTKGSADGDCAIKVRTATEILEKDNVDFIFDGELQLDAAIVPEVAKLKCPNSKLQGDANVFVFPDLESGNIGYKIMQRFGGFYAFGPIAQGMRKPINDLSRGSTVDEIIMTIAITTLQN